MESVFAEYRSISAPNQDSLRLDYNSFRDSESQPSFGKWKIMCFQTASFDGNFLLGFRNMIWKSLERTKKFEYNLFKQAFDWESLLIFHALGIPVIFFFASRGFWNWTQTDILIIDGDLIFWSYPSAWSDTRSCTRTGSPSYIPRHRHTAWPHPWSRCCNLHRLALISKWILFKLLPSDLCDSWHDSQNPPAKRRILSGARKVQFCGYRPPTENFQINFVSY